jgi:guanylate kinase
MAIPENLRFVPPLEKQLSMKFIKNFKLELSEKFKKEIDDGSNLIILLGSSGVGRDTVLENCLSLIKNSERIKRITTRSKRSEEEKFRLIFVNKKKFLKMLKFGEIVFACCYKVNNEFYGISKKDLLKLKNKKKIYLFECTLLSLPLKKILPKAKLVVLIPPSLELLKLRLKFRGEKDWRKRFKNSSLEIKHILKKIKKIHDIGFIDLAFVNSNSKETAKKIKRTLRNRNYIKQFWHEFLKQIKNYEKSE